ncbi:unnamed protein product (macronuclear) [Paramecium tetraurelia]|uniref:DOMON domain-containing protein n=1 Tax=Paramecium tetraurelia TaxID=5888 RepID=A0EAP9_PARTE|nr:uncharacterized protein GSPATT00025100001 [Paramecium tetraurelia]CAK92366.1 unnamed protein product [Paramecium tetraurelia]|eukprot:XP_001459763.1 hypothetical protein (macronuclear) [Paramecium tetraurelia strain d4-2]
MLRILVLGLIQDIILGSKIFYYHDPGNDISKPRTHAKISKSNTIIDFYFEFSEDQKEVTMMIEIDKISYFSLGLGKSMGDADLWVFEISNNVIIGSDSHCSKHQRPPTDVSTGGTDDIEILGYYYNQNGKSGVKFKRKSITGDKYDKELAQKKGVDFIWAHGKNDQSLEVSNHGKTNYGYVKIDLIDKGGDIDVIIENDSKYYQLHKWTNFSCWGVASDLAIIVGRYFKTWGYRTYLHGFLFILIISSSLTTAIFMLSNDWEILEWKHFKEEPAKNKFHIVFFITLSVLMIVQCIGGIMYNMMLISHKINKQVSIKPSIHAIAGSIVYAIGKLQIIAGLFMDNDIRLMLILGAVLTIRFILEVIYQRGTLMVMTNGNSSSSYFKKHKVLPDKEPLLLNINQSNFEEMEVQSDKLWCIFHNQIIDLSQMIHPGGNYIWKLIQGQDITKYVLGAYPLPQLKLKPYAHTVYAFKALSKYKTGVQVNQDLELFYDKTTQRPIKKLKAIWTLTSVNPFTELIAKFEFTNPQFQVKTVFNGLDTFGAYFIIKSDDNNEIHQRQYTMVLSMTNQRVKYRKDILELYKRILNLQPIQKEIPKLEEIEDQLPLIIKKYEAKNGFSNFLHEDNRQGQYIIEGPFGNSIQLENNTNLIFIAGGTGLFPFLDILDYQLRVSYIHILKMKLGQEAANLIDLGIKEIKNFTITMFLAVNSIDDLIGRDIYFALLSLQQYLDSPNFKLIVKGNFKLKECPVVETRFTQQTFMNHITDMQGQSTYFICGPPKMNVEVEQILREMGIMKIIVL